MQVSSNNINLEVQEFGHKDNIPLIMIKDIISKLWVFVKKFFNGK